VSRQALLLTLLDMQTSYFWHLEKKTPYQYLIFYQPRTSDLALSATGLQKIYLEKKWLVEQLNQKQSERELMWSRMLNRPQF